MSIDIALVLGSGGARGNAHIGVLQVLEDESIKVKAIAGTSFGGIVGAVYAAGYSPREILNQFSQVDQSALFSRNTSESPAIFGNTGVYKVLHDMLGERKFNDLRIPFAVTATDIDRGREVILKDGKVIDAILATTAVPGVFPPTNYHGYRLVDGAVLDPVPVSVVRRLNPFLPVVAVVLSDPPQEVTYGKLTSRIPGPESVVKQLSKLRLAQAFQIFAQSVEIGARAITELRLSIDRPDVIIRPGVPGVFLMEHVDVFSFVQKGETATKDRLTDIRRSSHWRKNMTRRLRYGSLVDSKDWGGYA